MIGRSGAKLRMGIHGEVTGLVKFDSFADALKAGKISKIEAFRRGWNSEPIISTSESEYVEADDFGFKKNDAKWWLGTKSGFGELYDAVFIGTPWRTSGVSLINTDRVSVLVARSHELHFSSLLNPSPFPLSHKQTIPTPDYVHLHVTLLVTNASHPSPAYFGRGKADDVPTTVLTSASAVRRASQGKAGPKSSSLWHLDFLRWKRREQIAKHEPKLEVSTALVETDCLASACSP